MPHTRRMPPDEELVRRMRSGDEDAARVLFKRHTRILRVRVRENLPAVLRRKVGESDVIQEAYLAAFLRLGDFEDRGEGSFGRWLSRILEHKIRDEVRRYIGTEKRAVKREAAEQRTSQVQGSDGDAPSPIAQAITTERKESLMRALKMLPDRYRTVLRLIHEEGLSLVDAGARMSRSAEAARKLYGRATSLLAQRLNGQER